MRGISATGIDYISCPSLLGALAVSVIAGVGCRLCMPCASQYSHSPDRTVACQRDGELFLLSPRFRPEYKRLSFVPVDIDALFYVSDCNTLLRSSSTCSGATCSTLHVSLLRLVGAIETVENSLRVIRSSAEEEPSCLGVVQWETNA